MMKKKQGINFDEVCNMIIVTIHVNDLYRSFHLRHNNENDEEEEDEIHKTEFIRQLIKIYMIMKSQNKGRKIADEQRGKLIRHKNKRAVITSGQ